MDGRDEANGQQRDAGLVLSLKWGFGGKVGIICLLFTLVGLQAVVHYYVYYRFSGCE